MARDITLLAESPISFDLDAIGASQHGWERHESRNIKLRLRVSDPATSKQRYWDDGADGDLESKLTEIFVSLVVMSERAYRRQSIRYFEWKVSDIHSRRVEARNAKIQNWREVKLVAREKKEARINTLLAQAARLRVAIDIREYVNQVLASVPSVTDEIQEWAQWAREEADRVDPVRRRVWERSLKKDE